MKKRTLEKQLIYGADPELGVSLMFLTNKKSRTISREGLKKALDELNFCEWQDFCLHCIEHRWYGFDYNFVFLDDFVNFSGFFKFGSEKEVKEKIKEEGSLAAVVSKERKELTERIIENAFLKWESKKVLIPRIEVKRVKTLFKEKEKFLKAWKQDRECYYKVDENGFLRIEDTPKDSTWSETEDYKEWDYTAGESYAHILKMENNSADWEGRFVKAKRIRRTKKWYLHQQKKAKDIEKD